MALGPAEGRESLVVDMELGSVLESDLRSLAEEDIGSEEGIDFDNLPVVVHSWAREDIVLGPVGGIVADRTELVGRREPAGCCLRNSCCST